MSSRSAAPTVAEWAWQRQSVWSRAADELKRGPRLMRVWRLVATVAAAALALAGSQLDGVSRAAALACAISAAVVMAGVGLAGGRQSLEQVRHWTRARSVSEALKTEIYLFLTRSGHYGGDDREQMLDTEVQRLEREAGDLLRYTEELQPQSRPLPAVHDVESYLSIRVREGQLSHHYEPKARLMHARVRASQRVEVALALTAAGLAAATAVSAGLGAWAAVATTAAGAVAAHAAAERYALLWVEYSRTATELRRLVDRRTDVRGHPLSPEELVSECEEVISVQNQAWMAKWGQESPPDSAMSR